MLAYQPSAQRNDIGNGQQESHTHNAILFPRSSTASPVPACPAGAVADLIDEQHHEDAVAVSREQREQKTTMLRSATRQSPASAAASTLVGNGLFLVCEFFSLKPGPTLFSAFCVSFVVSRFRRFVAHWLFNCLPWCSVTGSGGRNSNSWSKVVSWRTSWFLSRASANHTESSQPAAIASQQRVATPEDAAEADNEDDARQQQPSDQFPAAINVHLYALTLGILSTHDEDLLFRLSDTLSSRPCPAGWSMVLSPSSSSSSSSSCRVANGIRFKDPKGALHISHPDIEFAVDSLRHEAQSRTVCSPAARREEAARLVRELTEVVKTLIRTRNEGSTNDAATTADDDGADDDDDGADDNDDSATEVVADAVVEVAVPPELAMEQENNEDEELLSTLHRARLAAAGDVVCCAAASTSQSPARLRHSNHHHHHGASSSSFAVPPPTEFDLVSPPRRVTDDGTDASPETRAHVDRLLDQFSAPRNSNPNNNNNSMLHDDPFVVRSSARKSAFANDASCFALRALLEHEQQEQQYQTPNNSCAFQNAQEEGGSSCSCSSASSESSDEDGGELENSPSASVRRDNSVSAVATPGKLVFSSSFKDHVSPARGPARKLEM